MRMHIFGHVTTHYFFYKICIELQIAVLRLTCIRNSKIHSRPAVGGWGDGSSNLCNHHGSITSRLWYSFQLSTGHRTATIWIGNGGKRRWVQIWGFGNPIENPLWVQKYFFGGGLNSIQFPPTSRKYRKNWPKDWLYKLTGISVFSGQWCKLVQVIPYTPENSHGRQEWKFGRWFSFSKRWLSGFNVTYTGCSNCFHAMPYAFSALFAGVIWRPRLPTSVDPVFMLLS